MSNQKYDLITTLKETLSEDKRFIDENGELIKASITSASMQLEPDFISLLLSNEMIKSVFFKEIDNVLVFDKVKFNWVVSNKQFLPDSYTKYKNKIGLSANDYDLITETKDISLVFPYKDSVLEGGQTNEEEQKDEVFYNEILSFNQVRNLLSPKALTNAKRYTVHGVEEVTNIDKKDNLIIKGNNLLALSSLLENYRNSIKLIYIDPPYNTGSDSFRYNDKFNRSTWLTFMKNRLNIARELLIDDGVIFVHCDDNEQAYLKVLMDEIFGSENFIANVPTIMNLKGNQDEYGFAGTHEYMLVFTKNKDSARLYDLPVDDPDEIEKWEEDSIGYFKKGANLKATGVNAPREKRPNLYFPVYISESGEFSLEKVNDTDFELYPITDGKEMSWRWQYSTMEKYIDDIIVTKSNGNYSLYKKQRPELGDLPTKRPKSIFYKPTYSSGNGTKQIRDLFGERIFNYPKPEELIRDVIEIGTSEGDIVLDFFMGSATTHAVAHKMNRQYIGIEQMGYINTVSVPRLQKVIEGEQGGISKEIDWQGGGSFIYLELKELNERYIKMLGEVTELKELKSIYKDLKDKGLLIPSLETRELEKEEEFNDLTFEQQKEVILLAIDKNKLYVNASQIDDKEINLSDYEKKLTLNFYGKESPDDTRQGTLSI